MTDKIFTLPPPGGNGSDGSDGSDGTSASLHRSRRGRADETYAPPNLLLTESPARWLAFTIIAVPLVAIVLFMQPWKASASSSVPPDYGSGGSSSNLYPQPIDSSTDTASSESLPTSDSPSADASPSPTDTGPDSVVIAYFNAINQGDYETAWSLGGDNLNSSYSDFVNGFSGTSRDNVTIVSVSGDQVQVDLDAEQTDGTQKTYTGTYTVDNGAITAAQLNQTN